MKSLKTVFQVLFGISYLLIAISIIPFIIYIVIHFILKNW